MPGRKRALLLLVAAGCAADPPAAPPPEPPVEAPEPVAEATLSPAPLTPSRAREELTARIADLEQEVDIALSGSERPATWWLTRYRELEEAEAALRRALEERRVEQRRIRRAADEDLRGLDLVKEQGVHLRLRESVLSRREEATRELEILSRALEILDPAADAVVDLRRRMEEAVRRPGSRLAALGVLAERLQLAAERSRSLARILSGLPGGPGSGRPGPPGRSRRSTGPPG